VYKRQVIGWEKLMVKYWVIVIPKDLHSAKDLDSEKEILREKEMAIHLQMDLH